MSVKRLFLAAAAALLAAAPAAAQEPLSWSFDRRLTDLEKRVAVVEKVLGVGTAPAAAVAPAPRAATPGPHPAAVTVDRKTSPVALGGGLVASGNGGSGVVVWSDGKTSLVATAKHVAPDDGLGLTVVHQGKAYPARVRVAVGNCDLAILAVDAGLPAAEVLDRGPGGGVAVTHFGKTTGAARGVVTGWVELGGFWYVEGDYPSDQGDSGAGLFDPAGRVVGIHCGGQGSDVVRKHAVAPSVVRQFVDMVVAGRVPAAAPPPAQYAPFGGAYCPTGRCPNVR